MTFLIDIVFSTHLQSFKMNKGQILEMNFSQMYNFNIVIAVRFYFLKLTLIWSGYDESDELIAHPVHR